MKVAITGSTGLVGSALTAKLRGDGYEVLPVVRRQAGEGQIGWDPAAGTIEAERFEGVDAVVHLAGENLAERRWTEDQKQRILDSRVKGTRLISEALAARSQKPKTLISASAIGYYGDHRDLPVDESSETGEGFLAQVCRAWEDASKPARDAGIRVVNPRFGVVLSTQGGALAKMITPFKMCAGGNIGNGKQVWSWVSIVDVVGAVQYALDHDNLRGPINVTSPNPSTNAQFTRALGHVLGRPTVVKMPAFAVKLALGEMAEALLLSSCWVKPAKLEEAGYEFKHPDLEAALRALLKGTR